MKKKVLISIISAMLVLGQSIIPQNNEAEFQNILKTTFHAHPDALGIMLHIEALDQSISWSGAVGYSNWERTDSIEADQPALIASCTKNFVAVSILRLIEKGKLELFQPLNNLLTERTSKLMLKYGFNLDSITVAHLLSHKSGIPGYTGTETFLDRIINEPRHRWTRDEQIELAITQGVKEPPGTSFHYTDTNYLLLTEIIEVITGIEFYDAIRTLVGYEKFGLNNTWFYTLENIPETAKPLVHQYVPSQNEDSYKIDNSFDLYGGGGLAATTKDLAKYAYHLLQGDVFENKETLKLMFTDVKAKEGDPHEDYIGDIPCEYYLGIQECGFDGLTSYWHAGYWGTIFRYFPDLNASVVLFVLNENEFEKIELDLMRKVTNILK